MSFAREGCKKIVIADRDEAGLNRTKQMIQETGGQDRVQVLLRVIDVRKAEDLDGLVEAAVKDFGRVDYAVNGAGEDINAVA